MSRRPPTLGPAALHALQEESFRYFLHETNPRNGLVRDKSARGWPASIAAVGMALACYAVGVERRLISRKRALQRSLAALRFFERAPHGPEPDATGHRGFYYHFLDMRAGRRARSSELSTVDTAFLIAGALTAAAYFSEDDPDEAELRRLAEALYRRADWRWALAGGSTLSHGWKPRRFLRHRWEGYDEALLLYVLALGSPTFPIPPECYAAWLSTYEWRTLYGQEYVHAGPLFVHQLSHAFVDFRGIQDAYMRERGLDYFENSRRATLAQREYAIHNPRGFARYGERCWGLTASDGPGPRTLTVSGVKRRFYDYVARGVPDGPDDGTLAPWAVAASLPFAPEIVLPTLQHCQRAYPHMENHYGLVCSFNPTFAVPGSKHGWISKDHFALDQGPVILMIENYRSGLIWRLLRNNPYIVGGLRRAGFRGGCLNMSRS